MKLMMVFEVEGAETEQEAQRVLDAYRERDNPFPVVLYRATHEDVRESGVLEQVSRIGPVRPLFVKPWPA